MTLNKIHDSSIKCSARTVFAKLVLGMLVMACQSAIAADQVQFGEPSSAFSAKLIYPLTAQAAIDAMQATLSQLSIAEEPGQGFRINTDYVEGPPSPGAAGQTTLSRYRFVIVFRPLLGNRTAVNITARVETATGPAGAAPTWHDATLFNLGGAHRATGWLYERFETVLAGSSITSPSRGVAPTNTTESTAVSTSINQLADPTSRGDNTVAVIPTFDVIGMHIGAHPKNIESIMNSRILDKTNEHLYPYKQTLTIRGPISNKEIPVGEYMESERSETTHRAQSQNSGEVESWWVDFTPEPGAERAAHIRRTLDYGRAESSPLETAVLDDLKKKYGEPSFIDTKKGDMLWSLDGRGSLIGNLPHTVSCQGPVSSSGNWAGVLFGPLNYREIPAQISSCGSAFVYAHWYNKNQNAPEAQRLVSILIVGIYSPSLVSEVLHDIDKRAPEIDKSSAAHDAKKAESVRPDL
jgi:hypothetical protein